VFHTTRDLIRNYWLVGLFRNRKLVTCVFSSIFGCIFLWCNLWKCALDVSLKVSRSSALLLFGAILHDDDDDDEKEYMKFVKLEREKKEEDHSSSLNVVRWLPNFCLIYARLLHSS